MHQIPNILSVLRLICAPILVVIAIGFGSKVWFSGLFGVMLLTDALDGYLARRLKAESELGRKLDSWSDYLTASCAFIGLWPLWPEIMRREWLWFVVGLVACFAVVIYGLIRWRVIPGYHTWLSKTVAVLLLFGLIPLLLNWSPIPFHALIGLQLVAGIEEMAIAIILPLYSGKMPTVWHAWCQKVRATSAPKSD